MGEYILNTNDGTLQPLAFGAEMREKAFLFRPGWRNLNHGSYGAHPLHVRKTQREFQENADLFPDEWINRYYPQRSLESRAAAAELLHAPLKTIVLVPNATTGTNTVLRNLVFEEGDRIICFSTTYGAVVHTIDYITETTPAEKVTVEFRYPIADDELVDLFKAKIAEIRQSGGRPKIAFFDTIVSIPGMQMPFERFTKICKEEGVISCIDGAHGIGAIPLDLTTLDPDFFVTNCHKWLHTSRGVAVLYVPLRNQHLIRTSVPTSHAFQPLHPTPLPTIQFPLSSAPPSPLSNFEAQFQDCGTLDTSPYLCIPAALHFRRAVCGGEVPIMHYCNSIVRTGATRIVQLLGGAPHSYMLDGESASHIPMANVRLPIRPCGDAAERERMLRWLWDRFVAEKNTRMFVYWYHDGFYVRLSGQVYLDAEDFEWAGWVLKELCERVNAGEYKAGAEKGLRE